MVLLRKNKSYSNLKHNIVIFICTYDPYKEGRHLYTFENRCIQNPDISLEDMTTKIILNTKGKLEDIPKPLKLFLDYVDKEVIADELTQELDSEVLRVSSDDEWREPIMTFEQLLIDCAYDTELKTTEENRRNTIFRMFDLGYSENQIRELYELSEEQYRQYRAEYNEKAVRANT